MFFTMLKTSSADNLLQLIGSLLIFAVILLIVWLLLKWMGNIQGKQMRNRNLQLLESMRIGGNKMISVVRVGTAYFVVAVGKDEINLIGRLDEKQAELFKDVEERNNQNIESFSEMFTRMKGKTPNSRKNDE